MAQPLIPFDQALRTLGDMFGSTWTPDRLEVVLRHEKGSMDQACDRIICHGDKDPQLLINELLGHGNGGGGTMSLVSTSSSNAGPAASPHPGVQEGVIWCWKETPTQMYKHPVEKIVGDPCDCWIRYDDYVAQELESSFQLQEGRCNLSGNYRVDFATMEQTNLATGYRREVQRMDPAETPIAAPAAPAAGGDAVYNIDGTRIYDNGENNVSNNNSEPVVVSATAVPATPAGSLGALPSASEAATVAPHAPVVTVPTTTPAPAPVVKTPTTTQVNNTPRNVPSAQTVFAQQDFCGDPSKGQLSFPAGAAIQLLPAEETNGWRLGRYGNQQGWFPIVLASNSQAKTSSTSQRSDPRSQSPSSQSPAASRISSSDILQLYGHGPPPSMNTTVGQTPAVGPHVAQQNMAPPMGAPLQRQGATPQKVADPFSSLPTPGNAPQQMAIPSLSGITPMAPPATTGEAGMHMDTKRAGTQSAPRGLAGPTPPTPPRHYQQQNQPQQQQSPSPFPVHQRGQMMQQPMHSQALQQPLGQPQMMVPPQAGVGRPLPQQQELVGILAPQPQVGPPQQFQQPVQQQQPHHHHHQQQQQQFVPKAPPPVPVRNSQRSFNGPTLNGINHVQMSAPQQQGFQQAPTQQPQIPQQMGWQQQQQKHQVFPPSAEKRSSPTPVVEAHEAFSTPESKATKEALSELDKEIDELKKQSGSMEKKVVSELVTRICCKLDGIDVLGVEELRSTRKQLIRKAERIDAEKDVPPQGVLGQQQQQKVQQQLSQQQQQNRRPQVAQEQPQVAAFPQPLQQNVPGFPSSQQHGAAPPQAFPNVGPRRRSPPPPQSHPGMSIKTQNNPPFPMQGNHQPHPPTRPVIGQQQPQQPRTVQNVFSIPSPEELAPPDPAARPADDSDSKAGHETLSQLEKEIDELHSKKASMEKHVLSELVTRICCKLDGIQVQDTDKTLRSRRKELIRKAESIDSTDPSHGTPVSSTESSGSPNPTMEVTGRSTNNSADAHPVANKPEMSSGAGTAGKSENLVSRSFMASPRAEQPSSLKTADILQMYSAGPPQLGTPRDVHLVEQAPIDLLDMGTSSVAPMEAPIAPPPAGSPPVTPMDGDLLYTNKQAFAAAPSAPFGAAPGQSIPKGMEYGLVAPSLTPEAMRSASRNVESNANRDPKHRHSQFAVAQFAFSGDASQRQLSFPAGAQIVVLPEDDKNSGWKHGKYGDQKGWFPVSYVIMQRMDEQQSNRQHQQPPLEHVYNLSMSVPSNVDGMVSDFETQNVMGGTSETAHSSIATLNHCPWQTQQQVASALNHDGAATPPMKRKKKKKNVSVDGTTTKTKNKAKGKKPTQKPSAPRAEVNGDIVQGTDEVQDENAPAPPAINDKNSTPQAQKKKKKKKVTKEAEVETFQSPIDRAPPQFEIPNPGRESYDSDGSQESHEFQVMGGAGDQLFWQRQDPSPEKARKNAGANPKKKNKRKPKAKPGQEVANGKNVAQKSKAAAPAGKYTGGAHPKAEKNGKKSLKKKQVAAVECVNNSGDKTKEATTTRSAKLKKNQSKKKLGLEAKAMQDPTVEEASNAPTPSKAKKRQSAKKVVSESEVLDRLTKPASKDDVDDKDKDVSDTPKKQRKYVKKKMFGLAV